MWPFKKQPEEPAAPLMTPPVAVGQRFRYLGVEMLCAKHWAWPYTVPVVAAEYVNTLGEIKHCSFLPADWPSLLAELSANAPHEVVK